MNKKFVVIGLVAFFVLLVSVNILSGAYLNPDEPQATEKPTIEVLPVHLTRRANLTARDDAPAAYDGPTEWEGSKSRKINIDPPIPAGTVLRVFGPSFRGKSEYFAIWGLDGDGVKSELFVSTTDTNHVENVRLRRPVHAIQGDTEAGDKWKVKVIKLP